MSTCQPHKDHQLIDLHYWPTPNGKKVSIVLEECEVPYRIISCNIGMGDQFEESFLQISPNNRMPAIVDPDPADGGDPVSVFESGACAVYIADKVARFLPGDVRGRAQVMQWVMWQMANQGPKSGECGHFRRLEDSQGDQSYAVRRFTDEVNRLFGVMNNQLYHQPYLAGKEYSIADMLSYPWSVGWESQGQNLDDFKHFKRWFEELSERPAVQRGMAAGSELANDHSQLSEEDKARVRNLLYNQRARPAPDEREVKLV